MDHGAFDLGELYRRVEDARLSAGQSWAAVARATGVAASTIRRFEHAHDAEADGVLAVLAWLGVAPEELVVSGGRGTPLPSPNGGFVRVDQQRVAAIMGARRAANRTTIQRLVAVAHTSGQSIASLTRSSAT